MYYFYKKYIHKYSKERLESNQESKRPQCVSFEYSALPPHKVASQLNIFTPVGIATAIVVIMNAASFRTHTIC